MPCCDALDNFVEISLKTFQAVNKQSMSATRMGEITIDVPDGADVLQLKLTKVLYSLEVGYTLISVGQLNDKGFEVTFLGRKCTIKGPDHK